MSKITFRADDDLVDRLEGFEASKSEVMRNALRHYLDTAAREPAGSPSAADSGASAPGSIDRLIDDRITTAVDDRLGALLAERHARPTPPAPEVSVNISLEGVRAADAAVETDAETAVDGDRADESTADGSKRKTSTPETAARAPQASHTSHSCTQCGETVAADHVYCPNCGEKAAHEPVCECGDELRSDWSFCPGCGRRTPAADVLGER